VAEVITLPVFDAKTAARQEPAESIKLGFEIECQLRDYVSSVAAMYNDVSGSVVLRR